MTRILTLDYLRGLAALSILIYHFFVFQGFDLDSTTFLGRIGIYGVTIFYILSGLTLYYVYNNRIEEGKFNVVDFFSKRIARIHPLLFIVTILSIVIYRRDFNTLDFSLNITGLFGFFKWDTYYAIGAWSIGNELTFYTIFPLLLISSKRNKILFYSLIGLFLAISLYFSFEVLPPLGDNFWSSYVNPLNQAIYFVLGVVLGKVLINKSFNQKVVVLSFIIAIIAFIFYPTSTEKISIISQIDRYVLSICCVIMVAATALLKPFKATYINNPLVFLGEISYSLYLIHPLVYKVIGTINDKYNFTGNKILLLFVILVISILVSWLSYKYFEKPMMKRINLSFAKRNDY